MAIRAIAVGWMLHRRIMGPFSDKGRVRRNRMIFSRVHREMFLISLMLIVFAGRVLAS